MNLSLFVIWSIYWVYIDQNFNENKSEYIKNNYSDVVIFLAGIYNKSWYFIVSYILLKGQ